ncbi:response regulator receiver protein [Paludibacter propionicigenes WB4]|uniref:Response regulator receiver protein n=1 Tax=Paludibacter propionicigenes (strain DSM 17365 / JCM 13257 / WB4) TaxID=694427 RepID=E4T7N9_PALPW|nr:LytTR family DNA-binding domain-containing protein [Paludibacter propionicigenes]ADQ80733.1 response regulator receiver protein [Paludibacter propionicigenes WB4]
MNSKIPAYLTEKNNVIRLILFTAAFALLFINIFKPFGSRDWYKISDLKFFVFASLIVLVGMLVVVISRLIMLAYIRKNAINYWQYGLWVLAEILSMSMFYALFTKFIPEENAGRDFVEIFNDSAFHASLILLLPYAILWLYFSWREKNHMLEKLSQEEQPVEVHKKNLIAFLDEKGELKISIALENLLYVDSADNYATIHYLNKSKLSHFLIRNSLKWMEENMTTDRPLVRCHRSYIVNLDKVKVLRKTKDGIYLELDAMNTPDIPVSKTYYERVMNKFSKYSV